MNDIASASDLHQRIANAFGQDAARGVSAKWVIEFDGGDPPLTIAVEDGSLRLSDTAEADADVTFWMADRPAALAILTGQGSFMEAFMAGQLRSDGHLILSLQLLVQYFGVSAREIDPERD